MIMLKGCEKTIGLAERLEGYLELEENGLDSPDYMAISACEITERGILVLGLKPENLMVFNISSFQDQVVQTNSPMQLIETGWPVQAMATDGSKLD